MMSLFEHRSFQVPKQVAERVIRAKLNQPRGYSIPAINFEGMAKPQEDVQHPRFQRPVKTHTLGGDQ
jgi:hypothetical protein